MLGNPHISHISSSLNTKCSMHVYQSTCGSKRFISTFIRWSSTISTGSTESDLQNLRIWMRIFAHNFYEIIMNLNGFNMLQPLKQETYGNSCTPGDSRRDPTWSPSRLEADSQTCPWFMDWLRNFSRICLRKPQENLPLPLKDPKKRWKASESAGGTVTWSKKEVHGVFSWGNFRMSWICFAKRLL